MRTLSTARPTRPWPAPLTPAPTRPAPAVRRANAMRLAALPLAFLALAPLPREAGAQQSTFRVAPALLADGGDLTLGARWDARLERQGTAAAGCFPRRGRLVAASDGTAALDPDLAPDGMRVALDGGLLVSLFCPGRVPDDPDRPIEGGFDFGALSISVQANAESDPGLDEAHGSLAVAFLYTITGTGLRALVPSVHLTFAAVRPLRSRARDTLGLELDAFRRLDANAVWHVPLFATPLTFHADVRYWMAGGLEPGLEAADEGLHGSAALGWSVEYHLSRLTIAEVFLRWSGGELPTDARDRKAWMLGVVVARR